MKAKIVDKKILSVFACTLMLVLAPASSPIRAADVMDNYCIVPPYVTRDVAPNIMIMMDNSLDMMNPAHPNVYDSSTLGTANGYVGYFKVTGCYSYSSNKFEEQLNTSVVPNRTYRDTEPCPSSAPFRGNLMNWATMSKYDVLQKVIIGGNTASKQGNAHTLVGIDGSWTKSYGGCDFVVNNGNLTISDTPSGAGCPLIASPASPIASTGNPETGLRFASTDDRQEEKKTGAQSTAHGFFSVIDKAAKKIIASALWLWDNVNIVSEAEAAACNYSVGTLNGTVGQAYTLVINATSGTTGSTNYIWSMTTTPSFFSSSIPVKTDQKDSTATWSGTPSAPGTYNFSITISRGANANCGPNTITGTIAVSCPTEVQIQTTALPNGSTASVYSFTVQGINGIPISAIQPYAWSAAGLPAGLSINAATGTISGNPAACGSFTPTITLTDKTGVCQTTANKTFVLTVSTTLQINTGVLSDGVLGSPYSFSMNGQGGVSPYTWSWSSSTLPPGLSMSAGGVISGTPSGGPSTYTVDVTLTDGNGCVATKSLTLNVTSVPLDLQIVTDSLPAGVKGQPYSYSMQGSGGTSPYTWTITGLPAGLTYSSATGVISGTPTNFGGPYNVTVTLKDAAATTVTKVFALTINKFLTSQSFNIKVDLVEEPLTDVNGNDIFDPGSSETYTDSNGNGVWDGKQGVFQKYWNTVDPKARWGLTNYTQQGKVNIPSSGCIPASPASPFYTAIQNVQASNSFPIAAGLYGDINYYGFSAANFPPYASASYDGCSNSDPIDNVKCRKNFVLIISSGADLTGAAPTTNPDGTAFISDCAVKWGNTAVPLVKNACYGFKNDLRADKTGKQNVFTYVVNTMGTVANAKVLEDAALAGGGKFYDGSDSSRLEKQLDQAFKDMLGRAASGTAASVLASGEGSGANLIQAVYYPTKKFGTDEIGWIGRLTNLWYFVDPNLNNSNIREDDGDKVLTLKTDGTHFDNIVQLYFDTTAEVTKAHRWADADGDTVIDATPVVPDIEFESLGNLWEAGGLLWDRNLSTSPRAIYTSITGTLMNFSPANRATLRPYLQAADDAESEAIIRYVKGEDTPFSPAIAGFTSEYRQRLVSYDATGVKKTWKLGDILNSTPKISSWLSLNLYHKLYKDNTYGVPSSDPSLQNPADNTHYITSTNYRGRGMIFAGANDGMLHAFKLGTLELKWAGQGEYEKARLMGAGLGEEAWAFIPKHALPYLKYTADPGYCHVYSIDLTPFIFDASIGTPSGCVEADKSRCVKAADSWRTIIIGGMRYGGACRKDCGASTSCVSTPRDDPADGSKGLGYSSYFALDITDQNNPVLLWEFAHEQLGFSTASPSVMRVSVKDVSNTPLPDRNGKWFVVLGSGPTGPIDSVSYQFLASSDQNMRLFVLDLKTGALLNTINTGVQNAFAGSMLNSVMDTDLDYQDDVMYIPYVRKCAATTAICLLNEWQNGGVLRLSTKEDTDPANWVASTLLDGIGPVTSSVTKLQNNATRALWAFFGTGRYFYEQGGIVDDAANQRRIFGVKEPCFNSVTGLFDPNCTSSLLVSDLKNVTNVALVEPNPDTAAGYKGWYIDLDADGYSSGVVDDTVRAERVITDPLAATSGVVFFTTYKPFSDACSMGGTSSIWAVKYNSGGDASSLLKGQALIQVSTGSIEQLNLADAFKDTVTGLNTGNRKSAQMQGVPPMQQGLSIIGTPVPVKRVLHIKER